MEFPVSVRLDSLSFERIAVCFGGNSDQTERLMTADPDSVGLGGESALSPLTFNLSTAIENSLAQSVTAGPASLSQRKQATANVLS